MKRMVRRAHVKCGWCRRILCRKLWRLQEKKHSFCNIECKGKWQAVNLVGKGNPSFGKKRSQATKAKIRIHHADVSGDKNPMYGVHLKGEKSGNWRGGPICVMCTSCGKEIPKGRKTVRNSSSARFFCDKKCYGQWLEDNYIAWNVGLTKETDERVKRYAEKGSKTQKERLKNKENHPMYRRHHGLTTRMKLRQAQKNRWARMSKKEREDFSRLCLSQGRPNKKELELFGFLERNGFHYKFVGNGRIWINGKNPDFINTDGEQKLIEFFGDYFHRKELLENGGDGGEARRKIFAEGGYLTLIVWEHELTNPEKLFLKVGKFSKAENRFSDDLRRA